MNISISGLPAFAIELGFIIVFSAPIWLAARFVGAENPSLVRAIFSLLIGTIGAIFSAFITGAFALILAPLAYLLSFKYILGTSMIGAIILAIVAAAGYVAMIHFMGAGLNVTDHISSS
ncbi:hypothetical protein [Aquirhabdus parva]|uniref:Uncharacterized protein n=1 Tax=Aquirhabdus parva TaxID=2283318 RepID=A0A345P6S8_9GAMM|nr:hypothetical protein [Aquirhabdus parva]AXI02987.1 hypothetical protein HYN46_09125 [Aquirhabdus parva]